MSTLENQKPAGSTDEEISVAKAKHGSNKVGAKVLGLPWDKSTDTLSIETLPKTEITTKRVALSEMAKVYDPLGLISTSTLVDKQLYRELRNAKDLWDGKLPDESNRRWQGWKSEMATQMTIS